MIHHDDYDFSDDPQVVGMPTTSPLPLLGAMLLSLMATFFIAVEAAKADKAVQNNTAKAVQPAPAASVPAIPSLK